MITWVRLPWSKLRRLSGVAAWALSMLPLLSLGPATAMPPQEPAGYLLYPQSNLCIIQPQAEAHAARPPHFHPRLTSEAVLPMSAADILARSLSRQHGG